MTTTNPCHDWLTSGGEDLWHPEGWGRKPPATEALAKRICRDCPVQTACLTQALAYEADNPHGMRHGIWGGLDAGQRAQLAKATA